MCQRGNGLIRNVNLDSIERRLRSPTPKAMVCRRNCRKGSQGTLERRVQTKRSLWMGQRPPSAIAKAGDFSREQ